MMSHKDFLAYHRYLMSKMHDIAERKNADYAGKDNDAFANFRAVGDFGICTPEQGFLTRMTDKFTRVVNLTKQDARVSDETIEDTLIDLANYAILFAGYLKSKNAEKEVVIEGKNERLKERGRKAAETRKRNKLKLKTLSMMKEEEKSKAEMKRAGATSDAVESDNQESCDDALRNAAMNASEQMKSESVR